MSSIRIVVAGVAVVLLGACATNASRTAAGSGASAGVAAAGTADPASAPFVGSKRSKKFYPSGCQTVQLIKAEDRVGFASMKDAESAGYSKDLFSADCRY